MGQISQDQFDYYVDVAQEQMAMPNVYQNIPQETYESTVVDDSEDIAESITGMTKIEMFFGASTILGILLIVAFLVRHTPFAKGVSDLFAFLSKVAGGKQKDKS